MPTLSLSGFDFTELQTAEGLQRLDACFLQHLENTHKALHEFVLMYRQKKLALLQKDISNTLIELAKVLEQFLVDFFDIQLAVTALSASYAENDPIFRFKTAFILKRAKRELRKLPDNLDTLSITDALLSTAQAAYPDLDPELAFANYALQALDSEDDTLIQSITQCCALNLKAPCAFVKDWASFRLPEKLDFQALVTQTDLQYQQRDGFQLTDTRLPKKTIQSELHYCVYCHEKDDDFCSKGFPASKKQPELGFKKNPLDVTLTGCPIEEKISEMHVLKQSGHAIGALAMIMLDNPMCPATGHRICNDCMKACIYQKQTPVNIPEIETRVLTDVLHLPWGVELYHLLRRWNPLRQEQYVQASLTDYKVLIAGLGPAGFTMAHHLLMAGCQVVGVDGLKIEALDKRLLSDPIYDFKSITEDLDDRRILGFGGVAEYGITVRWDKNFLKLIYISLAREHAFSAIGNVRFGGTLRVEDAKALGVDHLCLALGAGLPKALPIPGSLAPGMRQANDFLMALQLTGAMKQDSLTNLQIRLPIVVIGGGLTGVDAATEAQAYYIRQVDKISKRYQNACIEETESVVRTRLSPLDLEILDEQLAHATLFEEERSLAQAEQRDPNFIQLIHELGGVSIVYRRTLQASPAYISNHEELQKALDQGVLYVENASPVEALCDKRGQVCALRVSLKDGTQTQLAAKTILVATGAQLNIAYSFEHKGVFEKENGHYVPHELNTSGLEAVAVAQHCKSEAFGPFTSYQAQAQYVSFIGDSHPVFHGNVVKAIGSAKRSYPKILKAINQHPPISSQKTFMKEIKDYFKATVTAIETLAPGIVRLNIHCKAATKHAKPGHFFRLQHFETQKNDALSEAVALFASSIDHEKQILSFTVLDAGISSRLCQSFQKDDEVALMGPTGVGSKVAPADHILVLGDALAVVQAQVLAEYAASQTAEISLITTEKTLPAPDSVTLKVVEDCLLSIKDQPLTEYNKILIVGSTDFMKAFRAYQTEHPQYFHPTVKSFAATYAPMQCMLKGVCAQCLVWQIDPATQQRTKAVYACSWQHQPLELVDLDNLAERLSQNSLQEKLA